VPQLNTYDRRILDILLRANHGMTTNDIATRGEISWNTAQERLSNLFKLGLVLRAVMGGQKKKVRYWKINR